MVVCGEVSRVLFQGVPFLVIFVWYCGSLWEEWVRRGDEFFASPGETSTIDEYPWLTLSRKI